MRVKHHFLRLARIGTNEHHPAVAQTHMRDLHLYRHTTQNDNLMAPVKLVSLSRCKTQRNIGGPPPHLMAVFPPSAISPYGIIASFISFLTQQFEQTDEAQPFAGRTRHVLLKKSAQSSLPWTNPGKRLSFSVIVKRRLSRPDHLAYRLPRYPKVPADRLDRLSFDKMRATDLSNCFHNKHPKPGLHSA
ncbi:hypothetical protein GLUCOINTEAF2_0204079 (plasmid) [Komagataeibacter intermedius AF2]|uniref:Uncharacterized protein n=1 Tax=Komagataeibacter intermedius AF2 TaxID=1458464 RepID=A0A0N1N6L3_9PROT|nr:hypothetical protein GLUCOINTEAF2_0204079 [Komagataeibacter intermedius AF2]